MEMPVYQKYMLTVAEAAAYFGIGVKNLRRFAENHPEVAVRYGNSWRIVREQMEEFIKNMPTSENGERII